MCRSPANRFASETKARCIDRKRENTSAAFFLSPEAQNTGSFVVRVYWGTLGRQENAQCPGVPQNLPASCRPLYSDYIKDVAEVNKGIVVNNALSPDVINANKRAFTDKFITRSDFQAVYGNLNATQFVDKLIQTTGVPLSAADRDALIAEAADPSKRGDVVFKGVD